MSLPGVTTTTTTTTPQVRKRLVADTAMGPGRQQFRGFMDCVTKIVRTEGGWGQGTCVAVGLGSGHRC